MSITISTDIFCDECSRWMHGATGERTRTNDALKIAKGHGWHITKDKRHLCPECFKPPVHNNCQATINAPSVFLRREGLWEEYIRRWRERRQARRPDLGPMQCHLLAIGEIDGQHLCKTHFNSLRRKKAGNK